MIDIIIQAFNMLFRPQVIDIVIIIFTLPTLLIITLLLIKYNLNKGHKSIIEKKITINYTILLLIGSMIFLFIFLMGYNIYNIMYLV